MISHRDKMFGDDLSNAQKQSIDILEGVIERIEAGEIEISEIEADHTRPKPRLNGVWQRGVEQVGFTELTITYNEA